MNHDAVTSSIEVGKYADLTVLDTNIFEVPFEKIPRTKVLLTMLNGQAVYRSPKVASSEVWFGK